jgi:hypothetical protein
MPKTGGLTAEVLSNDTGPVGLGYGLCWRKELNWQFMCWEYTPVDANGKPTHSSYPKDDDENKENEPPVETAPSTQGHSAISSRHRKKKKHGRTTAEKSPDANNDPSSESMNKANPYVNSFARVHV